MPVTAGVKNNMSPLHRLKDKASKPNENALQFSEDTAEGPVGEGPVYGADDQTDDQTAGQIDDQVTLQYTEDVRPCEDTCDEDICVEYTFELDDFIRDLPAEGRSQTSAFTSVVSGDIASVAAQVASHVAAQVSTQIAAQVTAQLQGSTVLKPKMEKPKVDEPLTDEPLARTPSISKIKPAKAIMQSKGEILMISLGSQDTSQAELRRSLAALDYCLARKITTEPIELSICGKSALVLKGYSHDDTPDIDIIDDIPTNILEYAEAFSVSNQARFVVPIDAHVFARRSVYPLDFDVLRVYLLSDADLLLNHICRGLRKDIANLMASRLLERVSIESVKEAILGYTNPEVLWKQYTHLRALGGL